ncbi:polyamine aminopropyltransferase [Alkalilimnicola sp. S0819]|uniref:polyamine aminopropyltransferase n=1 Tax=Alkalilimnicola sp. S0819 TaxID=2613922 RepID=UPI00126236BF|nr:polyamine aminopropyltransferase [Alkalilimnicola sp. S0819]KAB7623982.1 polyamine aminopropyltransferase [Alkalilimnicola sp. S0819]MPQ16586.1 polyamine aminopropyltransferase [Alkalilimnicola sp. S0819]
MIADKHWFTEALEDEGLAFSMKISKKLHEEQTEFQRIEVYQTTHWGRLMVIDGCVMLSSRDNFVYHEMMAHPVLYTHPNPKRVLIIGGGDCGLLREVLKHPGISQVTQVDIDEGVTRAAREYFPELCESNDDPRATLLFDDGVKYLQDLPAQSVDVVIVDSTDPVGPAAGLFGVGFMRDVHRALREDGLMIQQSESPILHRDSILKELYGVMREAGFAQVATLSFPVVGYPSGWWSATMAGKGAKLTEYREADAATKPFATEYYNVDIHRGALAVPEFCKGLFTDQ